MNHDPKLDDLFRDAYKHSETEPSDKVWEKLEAGLDKQASERYKKKLAGWKKLSILLMFLLVGVLVHETGIFNKKEKFIAIAVDVLDEHGISKNKKNSAEKKDGPAQPTMVTTINSPSPENNSNSKNDQAERLKKGLEKNNKSQIAESIPTPEQKLFNKKVASLKTGSVKSIHDLDNNIFFEKKLDNKPENGNSEKLFLSDGNSQTTALKKIVVENIERKKLEPLQLFYIKNTIVANADILKKTIPVKNGPANNKKFKPFWIASVIATNDWDGYDLDDDNDGDNLPNTTMRDYKKSISTLEKHKFSYTIGFMITRQFKERWGLKTGFTYSNTTIAINPQTMYAVKEPNGSLAYRYITSTGFGDIQPKFGLPASVGDSLKSATAAHHLHTLSLPVVLSYKLFERKRFSISPSIGFSANYITKAKVETEVMDSVNHENISIGRLQGVQRFYLGFMADVNFQYAFSNKISLSLLPTLRYALTPITKQNVVETYPFGLGLGIGLNYKF